MVGSPVKLTVGTPLGSVTVGKLVGSVTRGTLRLGMILDTGRVDGRGAIVFGMLTECAMSEGFSSVLTLSERGPVLVVRTLVAPSMLAWESC